ncbi:CAMK family protein kinase [Metarhizium rileyi]|uniref:CAMK family protein kinase n=1 Tax=Metarhizium rileyi (strain RCEF 4871) TaxID=1649241 RepID=A0A166W736_METRR|nr:CAMK family protein kinase [Metarhizium rileyi RCEF 4871]
MSLLHQSGGQRPDLTLVYTDCLIVTTTRPETYLITIELVKAIRDITYCGAKLLVTPKGPAGDYNAKQEKKILIKIHDDVQYQIVVAGYSLESQEYRDKVKNYQQGNVTTEELFGELDAQLRPDTDRPTGVHTPHASQIYIKKEVGRGNGEEHALKEPARGTVVDTAKWLEEADTQSKLSHDNIVKVFWADLDPRPRICLEYIRGWFSR